MRVIVDIDVPKNVSDKQAIAYIREAIETHSATYVGYLEQTNEMHPYEEIRDGARRAKVRKEIPVSLKVFASSAFGGPHTNSAIVVVAKSPLEAMAVANRRLNEADLGCIDSSKAMAEVPLEEGFTDVVSSFDY